MSLCEEYEEVVREKNEKEDLQIVVGPLGRGCGAALRNAVFFLPSCLDRGGGQLIRMALALSLDAEKRD